MKGIVTEDFRFVGVVQDEIEIKLSTFEEEDVFGFHEGDEVEVLKTIEGKDFISGLGYVIYNPNTAESITIDSMFVTIITDELDDILIHKERGGIANVRVDYKIRR